MATAILGMGDQTMTCPLATVHAWTGNGALEAWKDLKQPYTFFE